VRTRDQASGGLQAVDAWQVHVHEHEIGFQLAAQLEGLLTRGRLTDHDEAVGLVHD